MVVLLAGYPVMGAKAVVGEYDIFDFYPQCEYNYDQGMCAASWGVVISKAMSLGNCIKINQAGTAVGVKLSPQNLINCSANVDPCQGFKADGDFAGALDSAQKIGINAQTDDPYTSFTTAEKGKPICKPISHFF
jgi:hypothetical protein